jgi:type 1 fimbria pilin
MRKSLFIIAALAIGSTAPALAADGTVTINGEVAPKCLFTSGEATITLGELAGSDGKLNADAVNGQEATLNGWCNGSASTIQVNAGPLDNMDPGHDSFDSRIHYTATADATSNEVSATDTTTGVPGEAGDAENLGLFSGEVLVTLSDAESSEGKLLLAGDYSGSVIVTLSPTA